MTESDQVPDPRPRKGAVIKRRWAIVSKAGGGAAVLAIAGALALGDPNDQTDPGQEPGGPSAQISSES